MDLLAWGWWGQARLCGVVVVVGGGQDGFAGAGGESKMGMGGGWVYGEHLEMSTIRNEPSLPSAQRLLLTPPSNKNPVV
jgi:hypothetical protein